MPLSDAIFFLVMLALLQAVALVAHELGHLLAGRAMRAHALRVTFGTGKILWRRTDRHGTDWHIRLWPIAAVVIWPDTVYATPSTVSAAFHYLRVIIITLAGPAANLILALLLILAVETSVGPIGRLPVVGSTLQGSQAEIAGLEPQDRIVSVEGQRVTRFVDVRRAIVKRPGLPTRFTIERDADLIGLTIVPEREEFPGWIGGPAVRGQAGILPLESEPVVAQGRQSHLVSAISRLANVVATMGDGLYHFALGRIDLGTVAIDLGADDGAIPGQGVSHGIAALLWYLALISVCVGIVNMLPMATFDGGRFLLTIYQIFSRRYVTTNTAMALDLTAITMAVITIIPVLVFRSFL